MITGLVIIKTHFSLAGFSSSEVDKINEKLNRISQSIKGGLDNNDIDYSFLLSSSGIMNPLLINDTNQFGLLQEPSKNEIIVYKVVKGDTIEQIAKNFNIDQETIIYANNLTNPNSLRIGQELLILPISGVIHKVKSGETVSHIASLYNIAIDKIIEFNLLTEDAFIRAGDILIIPGAKPLKGRLNKVVGLQKSGISSLYADLPSFDSYYIYPTVRNSTNWGRLHRNNAVDIATSCGSEIYAAAGGNIRIADSVGYNGGYGKYVVIDHDNQTSSLYAHMSKIYVEKDQYVNQGDVIGLIGSTGRSTGCHLHFEVRGARNPFVKY